MGNQCEVSATKIHQQVIIPTSKIYHKFILFSVYTASSTMFLLPGYCNSPLR